MYAHMHFEQQASPMFFAVDVFSHTDHAHNAKQWQTPAKGTDRRGDGITPCSLCMYEVDRTIHSMPCTWLNTNQASICWFPKHNSSSSNGKTSKNLWQVGVFLVENLWKTMHDKAG
jgi:hypothetical protein